MALSDVYVSPETEWRPHRVESLLGEPRRGEALLDNVVVLEGEASVVQESAWDGQLYRELEVAKPERRPVRLIPYFAWANRGTAEMIVWLPLSARTK